MSVTDELFRLGQAARRLNDGADLLDRSLAEIDAALGRLMLGFEYQLPRPIAELEHTDRAGKRVIEVHYLGYLRCPAPDEAPGTFHLAVRSLKVFETRNPGEAPGRVVPLLEAQRSVRHAAVDHLAMLVAGLAEQVDEMVSNLERRNEIASTILANLERGPD